MSAVRIALLRHGLTQGNLESAYIGSTDLPLCTTGISRLREYMQNGLYPPVEQVFSSPLCRAVQTAELLYPDREIAVIPSLAERDFGEFEGMTHAQIIHLPGRSDWGMDEAHMDFPGGERWEEFQKRTLEGFYQVLGLTVGTAAVVCHGGTMMALLENLVPQYSRYHWQCLPGHGYLLECQGATIRVLERIEG